MKSIGKAYPKAKAAEGKAAKDAGKAKAAEGKQDK